MACIIFLIFLFCYLYYQDADEDVEDDSDYASASEDFLDSPAHQDTELNQQPGCVDDDDDELNESQLFV